MNLLVIVLCIILVIIEGIIGSLAWYIHDLRNFCKTQIEINNMILDELKRLNSIIS